MAASALIPPSYSRVLTGCRFRNGIGIVAFPGAMFDASDVARFSGSLPLLGCEIELIQPRKVA